MKAGESVYSPAMILFNLNDKDPLSTSLLRRESNQRVRVPLQEQWQSERSQQKQQ